MARGRYFVEHHLVRREKDNYRLIVTNDRRDKVVRLSFHPLDGGPWISRAGLADMGFPCLLSDQNPQLKVRDAGFVMMAYKVAPMAHGQVDGWKECYASVGPILKGDTGGFSLTITASYPAVKDDEGEPLQLVAEGLSATEDAVFKAATDAFHEKYPYISLDFKPRRNVFNW